MLTSKEIIERTGISRATLNNYIASGLVPRPQVLPPGPQDGAAPRIGYFPDDTIDRVETIQRLKREGWSITRISEYFAGQAAGAGTPLAAARPADSVRPPEAARSQGTTVPSPAAVVAPGLAGDTALRLSLGLLAHPAYLVDDSFRLVWWNDEARSGALSPLAHRGAALGADVLPHLFAIEQAGGRDAVLALHVQAARERGVAIASLAAGLPQDQARSLNDIYQAAAAAPGLVTHAALPAHGNTPARSLYAIQFREGVLFAWLPAGAAAEHVFASAQAARPAAAPRVTPVAVLVSSLQDASGLWVRLTAQEYFELLNEVATELDRIFRLHHGHAPRQPGEVLVCYFLPAGDSSYLWNALAAAQQTRDAMRQVSRRWQLRKGWDVELSMNIGIDEGQDWIGALGAAGEGELRVLGDAPDRATQLSRSGRVGAILVTRNLLGKLSADERQRLTYGVPRPDGAAAEGPLLFTFARLQDIAAPLVVPARFADLAVAELLDLHLPTTNPAPRAAG